LKSLFYWIVGVVAAFMFGPYLMGAIYAVAALPIFSVVCGSSGNPISFVRDTVNYADYQTFLSGRACSVSASYADLNQVEPPGSYQGPQNFWHNDVISNVFARIGSYCSRRFFDGAGDTALSVTEALASSVLVRLLFFLGQIFLPANVAMCFHPKALREFRGSQCRHVT
jgi:hypothetical protein